MPRVIHFEIPADDPERAVEFYKEVFGWEIEKWNGPFDYWLVKTGEDDQPGINGAIMTKMMGDQLRNTIAVESFDDFASKILTNGGKSVIPKMTIPNIGTMGSFEDTEGNVFLIMEPFME